MRVQPDGIYPELFQVIELADDPGDIAETISVRVVKRGRVDLVDESFLPPGAFVLVRVAVHGKSGILALGVGEGDVLRHRETGAGGGIKARKRERQGSGRAEVDVDVAGWLSQTMVSRDVTCVRVAAI